jgi:hypothetical protein
MSEAVRSHPFSVYFELAPGVYSRFPEVIGDIKTPEADRAEINVTNHDSDAEEFLLGLKTYGEASFDFNVIPGNAVQEAVIELGEANEDEIGIKVTDDEDSPTLELTFDARVKPATFGFGDDEQVKGTIRLRSTGDVTLSAVGS